MTIANTDIEQLVREYIKEKANQLKGLKHLKPENKKKTIDRIVRLMMKRIIVKMNDNLNSPPPMDLIDSVFNEFMGELEAENPPG